MADPSDPLATLPAGYRDLLDRARRVLESDERVRALWLGGSLARGDADAASDLDLLVAVRDDARSELAAEWRSWLARITPTVIARALPFLPGSLYSVTPDGLRLDVVVEPVGALANTPFRTRRVVFDRDELTSRIPAPTATGPSRERIAGLIEEFFRDVGMFDVAITRRDLLLGNEGIHMTRSLLYQLFCEANAPLPPRGVKQWSAKLQPAQRELLESLPTGASDGSALVGATAAVYQAFLRSAREIAADHGIAWPSDLEASVRAHLRAHGLPILGPEE
jgi:hypothetical protein